MYGCQMWRSLIALLNATSPKLQEAVFTAYIQIHSFQALPFGIITHFILAGEYAEVPERYNLIQSTYAISILTMLPKEQIFLQEMGFFMFILIHLRYWNLIIIICIQIQEVGLLMTSVGISMQVK